MYKKLSENKVNVSPYKARRKWSLTNDSSYLTFHIGANNTEPFSPEKSSKNSTGTYVRSVYEVIKHKFYHKDFVPFRKFGVVDPEKIDLTTFPYESDGIIYVLKISSRLYGKRIRRGSFKIQSRSDQNPITAVDDRNGNLISQKNNNQIGNVFYSNGIAVLTKPPEKVFEIDEEDVEGFEPFGPEQNLYTAYPNYEKNSFDLLFQQFELEIESVVQNFENEISAEIRPDEFGATINTSARKSKLQGKSEIFDLTTIEAIDASNSNQTNTFTFFGQELETREEKTSNPINPLADGDFRPYVTSIGFYNDDGELTATGKLARPVKLPESTPMTILGRFDT